MIIEKNGYCYVGVIRFFLGIVSPSLSGHHPTIMYYKKIKLGRWCNIFVRTF